MLSDEKVVVDINEVKHNQVPEFVVDEEGLEQSEVVQTDVVILVENEESDIYDIDEVVEVDFVLMVAVVFLTLIDDDAELVIQQLVR